MNTVASITAQAKINLRLRVLSRDTTGHHALETIFHRLALADTVTLSLQPEGTNSIHCSVDVGPAEQNLAYRAATSYLRTSGWNTGFSLIIDKQIPARGGLGGGSADAAATLHLLNALNPTPLTPAQLVTLSRTLGADVPFLASDAVMALAWGHGDRMLALEPLPQRHVVLVLPPFGVSTVEAFGWIDTHPAMVQSAQILHPQDLTSWDTVAPLVQNDFTAEVAARHPLIPTILHTLRDAGAQIAEMSGSGSTVYGVFEELPDVAQLQRKLDLQVLVTQTARAVTPVQIAE